MCNDLAIYCTTVARMLRTLRLPMKVARLSHCRTWDTHCLATLQAHLATALRVSARQSCEHRTAALYLVKTYMRYAILSVICRMAWRVWQITRQNNHTIDVKQALIPNLNCFKLVYLSGPHLKGYNSVSILYCSLFLYVLWHIVLYRNKKHFVVAYLRRNLWRGLLSYLNNLHISMWH